MNFESAKQRGELAEQMVIERFRKNGRIIYEPSDKDTKSHSIDMFVNHPTKNQMIGVEVKTQRQFKWHDVNTYTLPHKNWNEYVSFVTDYGMELMLIFVDIHQGELMFASMSTLMPTQWEQTANGKLQQFPLMVHRDTLSSWRHDKILLPVNRFQVFDELTPIEIKRFNEL